MHVRQQHKHVRLCKISTNDVLPDKNYYSYEICAKFQLMMSWPDKKWFFLRNLCKKSINAQKKR